MTVRRVVLLVNPESRHGHGLAIAREAATELVRRSVVVETCSGIDADDAARLAGEIVARSDVDALVSVGGDGSIRLALEAARGTSMPVGVVPAGTGNDLARALAIPIDDAVGAVEVLLSGRAQPIDLARVTLHDDTSMTFVTVAATGFDAEVTARAVEMSWPTGQARYTLAAVRELVGLAPRRFRIRVDGQESFDADAVFAAVGNTRSYGGGMKVTPGASVTDGMLDVTTARYPNRRPRLTLARVFPRVFDGSHIGHPLVTTLRGKRIEVSAEPTALVSVDGDVIGTLPATFEILPAAVKVIAPV